MKASAFFLLFVGCLWFLFDVWLLLTIAGIASPSSVPNLVLYWSGLFLGPISLVAGSLLLLRSSGSRYGLVLVGLGCLLFTGFALYSSLTGMQHGPLQPPPLYVFYIVLLVVMVLSDLAAYRIWRAGASLPPISG